MARDPIWPLVWETPYFIGAALIKKQKTKKQNKQNSWPQEYWCCHQQRDSDYAEAKPGAGELCYLKRKAVVDQKD